MKKQIIAMSSICLLVLLFACGKKQAVGGGNPAQPTAVTKANNCSCSASGFWSSCSITCPVKNGICLANCSTATIYVFGIPVGSSAICTCGSATVGSGRLQVGPEVVFDTTNAQHLEAFAAFAALQQSTGFVQLKGTLATLLNNMRDEDGTIRADAFNAFLNDLYQLSEEEARLASEEIERIGNQ